MASAEQAYLFRHALLREAAYQLYLPGERARLHGLALSVMETLLEGRGQDVLDAWAGELSEHARLALLESASLPVQQAEELQKREHRYLRVAADVAYRNWRLNEAVALLTRQAEHPLSTPLEKASAFGRASSFSRLLHGWAQSREFIDRGVALARAHDLTGVESRLMGELISLLRSSGRNQEVEQTLREQRALADRSGEHFAQVICCIQQGDVANDNQHYDQAEQYYREAIALAQNSERANFEARLLGNIAGTLRERGRYAQAESIYLQAIEGHKRDGDLRAYGNDNGNLASNYRYQGRLEEAARHYHIAIEALKQTPYRDTEGIYWFNLGGVLAAQQRFAEAEAAQLTAIAQLVEGFDPDTAGVAQCSLAALLKRRGDHAGAARLVADAQGLWREAGLESGESRAAQAVAEAESLWKA